MGVRKHGASIYRTERWKAVRHEAKRRDGWKCVQCGARGRLEVDHKIPVRINRELAFDLTNLQTLCIPCHSRKTRIEVGMGEPNPKRDAWRRAVAELTAARPSSNRR